MKTLACLFLLLLLAGCDGVKQPTYVLDQKLRHEYFLQCLKAVPAGPVQTHYNDWDEVVDSCDSAAYHQALILEQPK